jgi:multidrug efflux pump
VLLSPTGNALATASAVEAKMKELSRSFPANIAYEIPYNITPVVKASIEKGADDAGRGGGAGASS